MTDIEVKDLEKLVCFKVNALKELMEEKFLSLDKALVLQSKEYERRLADLNGEADRIKQIQAACLPRESYEIRHDELYNRLTKLEEKSSFASGRDWMILALIAGIPTLLALAALILGLFGK